HTRFSRDWCSDVCSSDLIFAVGLPRKNEVSSTSTTATVPVATITRPAPNRTPASPGEVRRQQEIDRIKARLAEKDLRPDTRKRQIGRASCRDNVQATDVV